MKTTALFCLTALVIASTHQTLSGETSGDWTYTVSDNQATITGYSGDGGEVVIPAELDGVAVVKVGESCFEGNTSVTSITIPDSVTSIEDYAFYNCTSLPSITIPDSVTSIGFGTFANCTSFTSVTIPDSVTSIGEYAFYNCTSLTSVTIPDSVTSIGERAFMDCTSLTSVTIPDSVTSIGERAFMNCTSLTSIPVNTDNLNYSSVDGVLFNKLQTSLILYPAGKEDDSYTIPDSVESIWNGAFSQCTSLTNITIPDSVESIWNGAFSECSSLTSVTIPDSVTSIGVYAFHDCTSLTSITIPDSIESIGEGAFEGCTSLNGDAAAMYTLGRIYKIDEFGNEAGKWYRKAAEQGHAQAQWELGVTYDNGDAGKKDKVQAHAWYRIALTNWEGSVEDTQKQSGETTKEQIAEAQKLALEMIKANPKLLGD